MPGERGDRTAYLEFHMTASPGSPMGLNFSDYDHKVLTPNHVIDELVAGAIKMLTRAITRNPTLPDQPLTGLEYWVHPGAADFSLFIEPQKPTMVWGDVLILFRLLGLWSQHYLTEECNFQIWAWPATAIQTRLGTGNFSRETKARLRIS